MRSRLCLNCFVCLKLKGCIVTLDAMGCQKDIATEIRRQQADYVLSLKRNHGHLFEEVEHFFQSVIEDHTFGYKISRHETVDGEHGRIEVRKYWSVDVPVHLSSKDEWCDLRSLAMVEATREVKGETSKQVRYYLSSLEVDAERLSEAVRGHWGIENSCHWILDVAFREDDCRVRTATRGRRTSRLCGE
ncbi:MAG TPA: ISAs1 family transposase [Blastocatellia bacterium]|nr:ISAs1 family transposase [Blastocatellia bacterium]